MSPIDEVISILKSNPPEINEDYFFIITDEIPIKEEEYFIFHVVIIDISVSYSSRR